MKLNLSAVKEQFLHMIDELSELLPIENDECADLLTVSVDESMKQSLKVMYADNAVCIKIQKPFLFSRALSLAVEHASDRKTITETAIYPKLETMIDASRNAILNHESFKRMVQYFALMGYSGIQMYTEDTYEVEGYPYFGYLRGKYTKAEWKEMDDYCDLFGIELIPCIQTLAHLGKTLRWAAYTDYTDYDDILLADDERTYALVEAMIKTLSESLRSKRINIGMDEAHMLGLGKYRDIHGETDRMDIMLRHFNRVKAICDKYGYRPMLWSDMFFRILNNDQYESNVEISEEKAALIPKDCDLIYWNYYSTDKKIYDDMLDAHKRMTPSVSFASGAWRWSGFAPHNSYSYIASIPAHESCKAHGVTHMVVTCWGDDGGEASLFSVLPSFQLWAECSYEDNYSKGHLAKRLAACTGGERLSDFDAMDMLTDTPENPVPSNEFCGASPSKQLLYVDPLFGLFDRHVSEKTTPHFLEAARKLHLGAERSPHLSYVYEILANMAEIVAYKVDIALGLRKAYKSGDRLALGDFAYQQLPELLALEEDFIEQYGNYWLKENKVFGLELFDVRMGGQKQRVARAIDRLSAYIEGDLASLPELEEDILYYDCREDGKEYNHFGVNECNWINIATVGASRNNKSY